MSLTHKPTSGPRGTFVIVRFKRWPWWKRLFRNHRKPLIDHVTYGGIPMGHLSEGVYYLGKLDED